jgi:hypothetical protein
MTEPKMKPYMVALNFKDGPLVLNAVMAPTDYAAVAMVTAGTIQAHQITVPLQGCAVMELTPEFIAVAHRGGAATVTPLTVVQKPSAEAEEFCRHGIARSSSCPDCVNEAANQWIGPDPGAA